MRIIAPMMILIMMTSTLAGCTGDDSVQEMEIEEQIMEIYGCMDSDARNYNSSATIDDGSCISVQIRYAFSSYCNGNEIDYLDPEWNIFTDYAYMGENGITTWLSPYITMYESQTMAYTVYSDDDDDCQIVMSIYLYVGDNDSEEIAHKEAYLEAHNDITLAHEVEV